MCLSREIAEGKWGDIRLEDWMRKCYRPQTNEDTQRSPYLCRRAKTSKTNTFYPLEESAVTPEDNAFKFFYV